jgi:hypothetical protein
MTERQELEDWLAKARKRLRGLTYSRGGAAAAWALCVCMLTAAIWGERSGYDAAVMWGLRATMAVLLVVGSWYLLRVPLWRLNKRGGTAWIEQRTQAFGGRLRTLKEAEERNAANPVLGLLAKDAQGVARGIEPQSLVGRREYRTVAAAAVVAVLASVWLLALAPQNWRYGSRYFLIGWASDSFAPPQSITVAPGDATVKRGANLTVTATSHGFVPVQAKIVAQFENAPWESVAMQPQGGGSFRFSFYGVHQPLKYYALASGVRSREYRVDVVDMPNVERIRIHYDYPEWTGLDDRTQEVGTLIQGVTGTVVRLEIHSDRPLRGGELRLNDQPVALESNGTQSEATIELQESGEYYLADRFGDEWVRLTDDQPVIVVDDKAPTISAVKPGRDASATNIEEVHLKFRANDDFRLQNVKLNYSVNGGEWQSREFAPEDKALDLDHVFYLEDFRSSDGASADRPLTAGDLISYYVEAADREQTATSDIYFIDVQGFERRYSQSQQSMGGQQGGGAGRESEISQRQREILVATWNLIKAKEQKKPVTKEYLENNSDMLAELQRTLAGQVETLIRRSRARGLDSADATTKRFIDNLSLATKSMEPAAGHLDDLELNDSVPPQQRALQHLLAAEALFRDIQVSFNRNGGGGGGMDSRRDMAEIYELEMDLSKNQYETRQTASLDEPDPALEDSFERLKELARRQEQLAEQARRNNNLSLADRWQQEQLRREIERLREQLQNLQNQGGVQDSIAEGSTQSMAENLNRQLEQIAESMRRASGDPQSGAAGTRQSLEAAQAAAEQLQRTLDEMARSRSQEVGERMRSLAEQGQQLSQDQQAASAALQEALSKALDQRRREGRSSSGLTPAEERELADLKRDMADRVAAMEEELAELAGRMRREDMPRSAQSLEDIATFLQDNQLRLRLSVAADAIDEGMAPALAPTEEVVNEILAQLQDDLSGARTLAAAETTGDGTHRDRTPSLEERLQTLKQQLADSLTPAQEETSPGESNTAQAQAGQAGNASGANRGGGYRNDWRYGGYAWGPYGGRDWVFRPYEDLPRSFRSADVAQQASEVARQLMLMSNDFVEREISEQELIEAQELARRLAAGGNVTDREIAMRLQALIGKLEQLELSLAAKGKPDENAFEARGADLSSSAYQDEIADYYRRLSEQPRDEVGEARREPR